MLPNIWKKFVGKRSIKMADQSGHTACHRPLPSKLDQRQLSCEILIVGGFEIQKSLLIFVKRASLLQQQ